MSPNVSQDHLSVKDDFTEGHGFDPGMAGMVLPVFGLLLIVAGDFASFYIAVARSFNAPWYVTIPLVVAMTAAAVLLMVEAGRAEAKRRSRNAGRTGKGPVRWRVLAWIMVGVTAFTLRMAAPPENTESSGFGQGSGFGSGLGGAEPAGGFGASAPSEWIVGPLTMHPENLVSALTLLAIFVAGGVGAFWFGKETFNPRVARVRRASVELRKAKRELRRAERAHQDQARKQGELSMAASRSEEARTALERLVALDYQTADYEASLQSAQHNGEQQTALAAMAADVRAELAGLPEATRLSQEEALSAGEEAKQHARVLIARYRGEPGATSGLINGDNE